MELVRDAGIHVISTCNVQHLDSVADVVGTITGAPVRERIPDSVLDAADEIELVDMSPHALRQRMRHGNVYPPDRIAVALDRFFTEPNLTALREIALRRVARSVDEELEDQGPVPAAAPGGVGACAGPGRRRRCRPKCRASGRDPRGRAACPAACAPDR